MGPLDLSLFAENEQKIPKEFLSTPLAVTSDFRRRDVFATHALDAFVILQTSLWFKTVLQVSVGHYMMTDLLDDAYLSTGGLLLNCVLVIFIAYTYFCASYFFNQGQTIGMKMLKKRISIESLSFHSALRWTAYSLSLYVTFGLTVKSLHAKLKEEGHGSFSAHDHLYEKLVAYNTWATPNLVDAIHEYEDSSSEEIAA